MTMRKLADRGLPVARVLAAAILLTGAGTACSRAPASQASALAYRMHLEQGGGRETWWGVTGPELGAMRTATGETQLLDGAAVGGAPATAVSFAGRPAYLAEAWRVAPDNAAGYRTWSPVADSGQAILDSLRFDLADAGAGPSIEGHATRHAVVQVESWWRSEDGSGAAVPFRATGRSDLYFAGDLPFSWLPVAATPRESPEAVPLSEWMPGVTSRVALALGPRLEKLGLLLRAEVWDSLVVTGGAAASAPYGGGYLIRTITVDSIASDGSAPSAEAYQGLPRLSERRSELVQQGLYGSERACTQGLDGEGGSFELKTSGPMSMTASGSAFAPAGPGEDGRKRLVMGSIGKVTECLVVGLPADASSGGTLPIEAVPPSAAPGSTDPAAATVLYLVVDPAHGAVHRVAVLESGTLELRAAGGGALRGKLAGTGWSLELRPENHRRVIEDLRFDVTFEAVPKGS